MRRALFVFAAGGDLSTGSRGLDDPAVIELAGDLDSPERRAALAAAIERLDADPDALERLTRSETSPGGHMPALCSPMRSLKTKTRLDSSGNRGLQ